MTSAFPQQQQPHKIRKLTWFLQALSIHFDFKIFLVLQSNINAISFIFCLSFIRVQDTEDGSQHITGRESIQPQPIAHFICCTVELIKSPIFQSRNGNSIECPSSHFSTKSEGKLKFSIFLMDFFFNVVFLSPAALSNG